MRHTSKRRRAQSTVVRDLTRLPQGGPRTRLETPFKVDASDPDAILCEACGVHVKKLASGRPKGHGPGGTRPNMKRGVFRCEGSGNTGSS